MEKSVKVLRQVRHDYDKRGIEMWRLVLLTGALALAGCESKAPEKPEAAAYDHSRDLSVGCYTVDLFDPYRLKYPANGVPREHSRFIGVWKDAAWNGEWCHDLYITEVRPDGTVTLLDAHGPYKPQNHEATVFKRQARISNGTLTFTSVGGGSVSYRLSADGGYLIGRRKDFAGEYAATMSRHDGIPVPPIPPKRPRIGS